MWPAFLDALLLQAGYNAGLVAVGAGLLGMAAGSTGSFLFLRKRALVSDASAHATLPGICIAFMVMVWLGGSGRNLGGLLAGSAISAGIGVLVVHWLSSRTRLPEDAAIGAVLSSFFGFGVVLLTVIQTMRSGYQAGLEGFLVGSTAGMLLEDAMLIAVGGAMSLLFVILFRRPLTLVSFNPEFAATIGVRVRGTDIAMMLLVMAVTVIGLKIVGLVLIVALLVIPPVAARFWTDRVEHVVLLAGVIGGISGYVGACLSASAQSLPTGPVIVLTGTSVFVVSLLLSPHRGLLARVSRRRRFEEQLQDLEHERLDGERLSEAG
jgi:manganese/zinc/iron transport system permease protein